MSVLKMIAFENVILAERLTQAILKRDTSQKPLLDQHFGIKKISPGFLQFEDLTFYPSVKYRVMVKNGEIWFESQLRGFFEELFSEEKISFKEKNLDPFRSPHEAEEAFHKKCETEKV